MAFSEFNSQFTSKKRRHEEAFPAELTNKPRPKRRPRRRRRPRYWRRPQFFPVKLSFASRPPPGRSWARAGRHDAPPQNTLPEAKRRRFSTEIKAEFSDQKVRVIAGPDDLTVVEVREIFRILDAGLRAGFGGDVYTADVMNAFLRVVFDSGCWSPDDPTNRPQMPDVRLPFTEVTFSPAVQCISSQVPEEDPFGVPHDFMVQPQMTIDLVPTPRYSWSFVCHGRDVDKDFTLTTHQIATID